jgi:hypothetical protein
MTPDPSLVADLHAYDPALRIRWARHTERWFIEHKIERKNPKLDPQVGPDETASKLARDLWESWTDGYVHVLSVDPVLAHWRFIAPELARLDAMRQGGMKMINKILDDENEAWEKAGDKKIENWAEAASKDAADHAAWFEGETVAVRTPEEPLIDTGLGFKVRDRRRGNTETA